MGDFKFVNIASGSKGNATLISSGDALILIDMGLTKCRLKEGLSLLGKKIDDIDAVFITHRHSDHVKGYQFVEHIPTYGRDGVIYADINTIDEFSAVQVGPFKVYCLPTSHDAPSPAGYLVCYEDKKLTYITDTGRLNKNVLKLIKGSDCYIFESNYDPYLLDHSGRPKMLINRIKSTKGHLSNQKSADYLKDLITPNTKQIFLAHLSEECNEPEIALRTHLSTYEFDGVIKTLWQWKMTEAEV